MTRFGAIFCILFLIPTLAIGQGDRARGWEAGGHFADFSALSLSGFRGASIEVESNSGYGVSGAYNFSNHLALGIEASWRSPNYRATFVPDDPGMASTISATMDVARIHLKGIYYFLESSFTPFVEVGYGWTRIDSNILERPPITGCWWDPWWGLQCRTTYTTYAETEPSYGAAIGLRWDSRGGIAIRGSIGSLDIDRGQGVESSSVDTTQIEVLWRF